MFNVRVYGLLINENKQVLVSDEYIRGDYITKFPGGGLEFGEGTRDCLKREFMEEMTLDVRVGGLGRSSVAALPSPQIRRLSFNHAPEQSGAFLFPRPYGGSGFEISQPGQGSADFSPQDPGKSQTADKRRPTQMGKPSPKSAFI